MVGVALVVVGLVTTALSLRSSGDGARSDEGAATSPPPNLAEASAGSVEERVEALRARVEASPDDWEALAALGAAYVAQAAVTGDPALYPAAQQSLERSLEVQPDGNLPATVAQSSLAAARHDFPLALDWAERAGAIAPDDPGAKAVLGDALLELGRYDEAFAMFQAMIDRRPDLAAYARISYARELQGDIDGAVEAMEAAESAASSRTDAAFAAFQLGELEWNRGEPEAAMADYERAQEFDPDAVRAEAALARAAWFAGDEDEAIERYQEVVARLPLPQYLAELADVYSATGRPEAATQQLEVIEAQRRLYEASGVAVDADLALINADNGVDVAVSLVAMRDEWEVRKSVFVADALAWLLQVSGRSEEALAISDQALRLGTQRAIFHFHRSEILRSLGDDAAAERELGRAQAINPDFSIRHADGP